MEITAFTGHRPNKLKHPEIIRNRIRSAINKFKPDKIISGMALGVDQIAAEVAIELKIPFIAAVPFIGQEKVWTKECQEKYHELLKQAEKVEIISEGGYAAFKMQVRNKWMVDNSTMLMAVFDGTPGGTANCVKYAKEVGRKILYIKP